MAQFYTLEEAARVLGMSADDLKAKAQQREVRAFMDSGSWRFRVADIDELARRRGMGSDPDLSLSDLDVEPPGSGTGSDFDLSEFQLGVATPDVVAPPSGDLVTSSSTHDRDILADDINLPPSPLTSSSSTIIGMESSGKHPSDSDVRLMPEVGRAASDSDVRLAAPLTPRPGRGSEIRLTRDPSRPQPGSGLVSDFRPIPGGPKTPAPSDSDVKLAGGVDHPAGVPGSSDEIMPVDPNATMMRPSPLLGSSGEVEAAPDADSSDFELTPSSVIDALSQPDSGSDFELTALDASDEFEATPTVRPSDSDVTGASPVDSGIDLARPSDSGINLQLGALDLGRPDSIELAPLDAEAKPPAPPRTRPPTPRPGEGKADLAATSLPIRPNKEDLSATALPIKPAGGKADLSATSLPVGSEKNIFEDTDFEVDAIDTGHDDRTVQLDASSDFDLEDSGSGSEVFAIDEDEVDQNAATAMAPAVAPAEDSSNEMPVVAAPASSGEVDTSWDLGDTSTPSATAAPAGRAGVAPSPILASAAPTAEWGGVWVGVLMFTTVVLLLITFISLDLVRNLYEYRGETPVASGLVKSLAGLISSK
ncbi:MAG TPA: helix-turn-helix domain-containing protein [Isosphaeraceae bacterium]|jgi:hypothetical protein|nr:helix-turn-helix domain-containing protein [Isosphaeraceae bacterium]